MKQAVVRLFSLCVAIILLIAALPLSSALAETKTVYVKSNTLKVYNSAKKVLGTMNFGQSMSCTAVNGSWARVVNGAGQVGYCKTSGLTLTNPNRYSVTVYAAVDRMPVYARPSTSSRVMARMPLNTKLTAVAITSDGKWLRLKNGNIYGYARFQQMSDERQMAGTKVWCNSDAGGSCAVTATPGGFDSIGTICFGESCWLLGYVEDHGRFAKIMNAAGKIGYADASVFTTKNPNTLNKTMYVQASAVPVFSNAVYRNSALKLNKNAKVTVVAESESTGWSRVKVNGKYYYIQSIFLASSKVPTGGRKVRANDIMDYLYAAPDFGAKRVAGIFPGEVLTLVSCKGAGIKVRTASGVEGYCVVSQLSKY